MRTPGGVPGGLLAGYAHVAQHAAQPAAGTQPGLDRAVPVSRCHSGELSLAPPDFSLWRESFHALTTGRENSFLGFLLTFVPAWFYTR